MLCAMPEITSTANPNIKRLVRLAESRVRRRTAQFIIETMRELERALKAGYTCVEAYCHPQRIKPETLHSLGLDPDIVTTVSGHVIKKLAYRGNPEGMIAVMDAKWVEMENWLMPENPMLVISSELEKPGNIGAILRSANAAGVDAVLIDDEQPDLFNPHCVRASTGAVFDMTIPTGNTADMLKRLQEANLNIVGATPAGDIPYYDYDFNQATALVMGSEAEGIDPTWTAACTELITIPMTGIVDSLNVSVSAGILMFEAMRQRQL